MRITEVWNNQKLWLRRFVDFHGYRESAKLLKLSKATLVNVLMNEEYLPSLYTMLLIEKGMEG